MTTEEWTADRCAAEWGVRLKTWHSYVARGFAPKRLRKVGRTPLWDAAEVRAWPRPGRGARTDLTTKRGRMNDPIAGELGDLILSGWWGDAPDGGDAAFLLLGTSDDRAPQSMPLVANALGFDPTPGAFIPSPASDVHVTISDDGWTTLHAPGGQQFTVPVDGDWIVPAKARGWVALAVSFLPMAGNENAGEHAERAAENAVIGLVPLR